jgi:hypothetical protein
LPAGATAASPLGFSDIAARFSACLARHGEPLRHLK